MFFKMSFHSFVPAEPVEDAEPVEQYVLDPVEVTILTDEPLGLLFNGVALGADDNIRLTNLTVSPVSIRAGNCRYRLTLNDGNVELGEGYFMPPEGVGQNLNVKYCGLDINPERYVLVKITDLEFSSAGVTMICTGLTRTEIEEIEAAAAAAAEPASENPDVDGETDSSE